MPMWPVFKRKARAESPDAAAHHAVPAPAAVPPRTDAMPARASNGIAFDPGLIEKLKGDHAELFERYTSLLEAAASKQFDAIAEDLLAFRRAFQTHLLVESVRFYIYLEKLLAGNPEELAYARSLKHEMNGIAKGVVAFIEMWSHRPPDSRTAQAFIDELNVIGQAMAQRVQVEESTLYTLYVESL